jgi:hypothetical protein
LERLLLNHMLVLESSYLWARNGYLESFSLTGPEMSVRTRYSTVARFIHGFPGAWAKLFCLEFQSRHTGVGKGGFSDAQKRQPSYVRCTFQILDSYHSCLQIVLLFSSRSHPLVTSCKSLLTGGILPRVRAHLQQTFIACCDSDTILLSVGDLE